MEVQRIASNIFFFFCKNMHDLYTSVHLRVTHCLTKFREAHYASNILSDILPGQRGKPNTVTLSIECNSILEAAQDQPASSLPETGGGAGEGSEGTPFIFTLSLSISYDTGHWGQQLFILAHICSYLTSDLCNTAASLNPKVSQGLSLQ